MQGSIGVMMLAVLAALLLVAGTSSVPWVAAICAAAAVAVCLDRLRTSRHDLR